MEPNSTKKEVKPAVKNVEVIGFGRRFLAIIIDGVIVFMASLLIGFLIGMVWMFMGWWTSAADWPWNTISIIVMVILSFVYYTGGWVRSSGQTLGKMVLGIRIVNWDGSPLTGGKLILRYLGYVVSALFASLGFIWIAIDKKRRGWHDLIAGTYVVSVMYEFPAPGEKVNFVASDAGKDWIWVVLWIFLALGTPAGAISTLWFLGPAVNNILNGLR